MSEVPLYPSKLGWQRIVVSSARPHSWDTTPCKVTPVIPHGVVSPDCKVTPVILHGVVSPDCKVTPVILDGVVSPDSAFAGLCAMKNSLSMYDQKAHRFWKTLHNENSHGFSRLIDLCITQLTRAFIAPSLPLCRQL